MSPDQQPEPETEYAVVDEMVYRLDVDEADSQQAALRHIRSEYGLGGHDLRVMEEDAEYVVVDETVYRTTASSRWEAKQQVRSEHDLGGHDLRVTER